MITEKVFNVLTTRRLEQDQKLREGDVVKRKAQLMFWKAT